MLPFVLVKFDIKKIYYFMNLLFLNLSSILHYEVNSLRYKASKMGRDSLDTLYVLIQITND